MGMTRRQMELERAKEKIMARSRILKQQERVEGERRKLKALRDDYKAKHGKKR